MLGHVVESVRISNKIRRAYQASFFMIWETALTRHWSLIFNDLGSVRSKLLRYRIE